MKLSKSLRNFGYRYAVEIGLLSGGSKENRCYYETEGLSRYIGDRIMDRAFPWLKRQHRGQKSSYDEDVYSGDTRHIKLEIKVRFVASDTYPDSKITDYKCDFSSEDDWWLAVYYWTDRRWYIWDLSEYKPEYDKESWSHKYSSSDSGDSRFVENQDAWVFDFSEAKYSGILERKTIKYAKEQGYGTGED